MMRRLFPNLAWIVVLSGSPAAAETLTLGGVYPAGNSGVATVQTITVEPFGGADGQALSIMVEDQLRSVTIRDDPWFDVVPASLTTDADAVLLVLDASGQLAGDPGSAALAGQRVRVLADRALPASVLAAALRRIEAAAPTEITVIARRP